MITQSWFLRLIVFIAPKIGTFSAGEHVEGSFHFKVGAQTRAMLQAHIELSEDGWDPVMPCRNSCGFVDFHSLPLPALAVMVQRRSRGWRKPDAYNNRHGGPGGLLSSRGVAQNVRP